VLDDGKRSKSAAFISIGINGSILLIIVILGLVVRNNPVAAKKLAEIYLPATPPAPKPPPPPKKPPVMPPKLPTPPKITPPKVTIPPPPEIVKLTPPPPRPIPPAPEVKIAAPPAPKIVNLGHPTPASLANADRNPSPVRLGNPSNPVVTTGPAVSPVNMNAGYAHMPPGNVGNGAPSKVNLGGNGLPNGSNMRASSGSVAAVKPVSGFGNTVGSVAQTPKVVNPLAVASPPKVLYKPTPAYTAEAKAMHLEGNVSLKIRVAANGQVEILNVVSGLGHGLDESAKQATLATRFKPAVDSTGSPVDWVGTVIVKFQLS
jgi:TonB family protein